MNRDELLNQPVEHLRLEDTITIADFFRAADKMSFTMGELARATDIYQKMLRDKDCMIVLALAGSTSAAGCMQVYVDMIKNNMVDVVVATGASIVDMDFFEALGFRHYLGSPDVDDSELRRNYVDRIYSVFIDEHELQACDAAIRKIADGLPPRAYSSQEFIWEMGQWLVANQGRDKKRDSMVQVAYEKGVPIFCPAFSDSSAGLGLVMHQLQRSRNHLAIDSVADFRRLTQLKISNPVSGLFMVGGGVPKNFIQDTVVMAELLGHQVPMHKYAVQITVADVRDGGCSSSTLSEARSWGKVEKDETQMVYCEATLAVPLIAAQAFHQKSWINRTEKRLAEKLPSLE